MTVVQQLINNGSLIKIQSETGSSIEDWRVFGGWTNNIGNFIPGEGYKVKVSKDDTLWIYDSYQKSTYINLYSNTYIQESIGQNGVDHMNINIVNLLSYNIGDKILAYDGENCVGLVVITENNLINKTANIICSDRKSTRLNSSHH